MKWLRAWARRIMRDSVTLWFACRDRRTSLPVKALCLFIVAYALSPIDLIPDFVPVLGYLDELILLPGLIWLAIRMLPGPVVAENRQKAVAWMAGKGSKPTSILGAGLVIAAWIAVAVCAWRWYAA